MAKLRDVLQFVAYGTALDIAETNRMGINHLFGEDELITREIIERNHQELLARELYGGIHAEGYRRDTLFIPLDYKN